jgi:uncharacterized integral membrane protein (TIGR00698 family)
VLSEDWAATFLGLTVLFGGFIAAAFAVPAGLTWETKEVKGQTIKWISPLHERIGSVGKWNNDPRDAFKTAPKKKVSEPKPASAEVAAATDAAKPEITITTEEPPRNWMLVPLLGAFIACFSVAFAGAILRGENIPGFLVAFPALFLLAILAYVIAGQEVIHFYALEYALWALLVGLIIANTVGTPAWLRPAVQGELYIKIGLVLLGAEVLFGRLLALGLPGVLVSWVVTPVVLISTYLFGQHVLKIKSKSLNLVVSADMSVCGVSAAIATAAACKAKKEELSLAIGLSLFFTVIMMIAMPRIVLATGIDPVVGGAWIGGTIDATGAVAAAGEALGDVGSETAVTIKMIQNILIGVIAFCVAIYWTRWVEPKQNATASGKSPKIGIGEIWKRFPKFVIGFVIASIFCSILFAGSYYGELWVNAATTSVAKPLRLWLFCLAFISLGLDTNIRELLPYLKSGKPAVLYVCGQTFSLILSLAMAYLMFGVIFKQG